MGVCVFPFEWNSCVLKIAIFDVCELLVLVENTQMWCMVLHFPVISMGSHVIHIFIFVCFRFVEIDVSPTRCFGTCGSPANWFG